MGVVMGTYQPLIYKIATEPFEFELIHRLNYRTFVEEIPQHSANREKRLVDRFHKENTYIICMSGEELLGMVKLTQFKDKQVGGYSSGMRQRVNVIRAILHDPDILFLDEPTTALDPQSTRFVRDLVKELKERGHTIVLTTHMMDEADELSDRVCIIDHGKIMAVDTPQRLKDRYKTNSLLDVFLELTGRDLRDAASDRVPMRTAMGRM